MPSIRGFSGCWLGNWGSEVVCLEVSGLSARALAATVTQTSASKIYKPARQTPPSDDPNCALQLDRQDGKICQGYCL